MYKNSSVEFEFDLLVIDGDNVIDNFKNLFGKKIREMNLNYEIFNMSEDKKMAGGSIDSGTSSTYPYNMFESTLDSLFTKKKHINKERTNLYDLLFRDFKGSVEEDYTKRVFDIASKENGNLLSESVLLLDKQDNNSDKAPARAKIDPVVVDSEPISNAEPGVPQPTNLNNVSAIDDVISSAQSSLMKYLSNDPDKIAPIVAQPKKDDAFIAESFSQEVDADAEFVEGIDLKKRYKIITLKLVVENKGILFIEKIKKG